jgi:hypothetical protein
MRPRVVSILLCSVVLWLAVARGVSAQAAPSVVVIWVEEGASALGRRLRQEVESLGLVAISKPADPMSMASLDGELREKGVVAALRVSAVAGGAVELAILDRADGSTVRRKLVTARPGDPSSAELLATRTVETLRASLIVPPKAKASEVAATPPESARDMRPPPPVVSPATGERTDRFALFAGPAILGSDEWAPGVHVLADLTYVSTYRIGVGAGVLVPVTPAHLVAGEGEVDLSSSVYRLAATFDATPETSLLSLRVSAGLAIARLHLVGAANPPNVSTDEDRVAWAPSVGLAVGLRLASYLRLAGEATVLVGYPQTVVRLAGREVSAWGRPAATGSMGLELSLPFTGLRQVEAASATPRLSR